MSLLPADVGHFLNLLDFDLLDLLDLPLFELACTDGVALLWAKGPMTTLS